MNNNSNLYKYLAFLTIAMILLILPQNTLAQFDDPQTSADKNKQAKKIKKVETKESSKSFKPESKLVPKTAPKQKAKAIAPQPSTGAISRQINVARAIEKPTSAKQKINKRKKTTSSQSERNNNNYTLILPEPGLEVLVDEQKQGNFSDDDAEIKLPLTIGKHRFIIFRNKQPIGDAILNVNKEIKEIDLKPYINENAKHSIEIPEEPAKKTLLPITKPLPESQTIASVKNNPLPKTSPITASGSIKYGKGKIFILSEPGLELLVDEQKKGKYSDVNGKVELNLTNGKHLFIVRRNGQQIGEATLIISKDKKEINLIPYLIDSFANGNTNIQKKVIEIKPRLNPENSAQTETTENNQTLIGNNDNNGETDSEKLKLNEQQIVLNRINEISSKYRDPLESDKVTISEWTYIYEKSKMSGGLPNSLDSKIKNALMSFAAGQIYLTQNKIVEAIKEFSTAVTLTTLAKQESAIAHFALGNAYRAAKNFEDAKKSYEQALKLDSKLGLAYKNLADMLYQNGNQASAAAYYMKALENGFKTIENRLKYANGLKVVGRYDEAIKNYNEINAQIPTFDAFLGLGECYYKSKLKLRAVDALQKALELKPLDASANELLGKIYYENEDYILATNYFQKAIDNDKDGKFINLSETNEMLKKSKKKSSK